MAVSNTSPNGQGYRLWKADGETDYRRSAHGASRPPVTLAKVS